MAKKKSIFRRIFNFFLVLFVLLVLAVGGVFAAIHFEVLDFFYYKHHYVQN